MYLARHRMKKYYSDVVYMVLTLRLQDSVECTIYK